MISKKLRRSEMGQTGIDVLYSTPEASKTLTKMFYDQDGITEMAVHFDRSERAIMNHLDKLGLGAYNQAQS